jgi:thioredoxin-like negative regulator of GroEL
MGAVVDATKETFDDLVSSGLVLVDVWAESCRPCVALAPRVEEIAASVAELTVVKLDAAKARRLCMAHEVRGLPTFLLFRDGAEVARITGTSMTPGRLDAWLSAQLDSHQQLDTQHGREQ